MAKFLGWSFCYHSTKRQQLLPWTLLDASWTCDNWHSGCGCALPCYHGAFEQLSPACPTTSNSDECAVVILLKDGCWRYNNPFQPRYVCHRHRASVCID